VKKKRVPRNWHLPEDGSGKSSKVFLFKKRLTFSYRKTYPDRSSVVVLLGPNEARRANIPKQVHYENFMHLKEHIDAANSQASARLEIRLPDVSPEIFDLAV